MNDDIFTTALTAAILVFVAWAAGSFILNNQDETVGQLKAKVANLEAELQAKEAAVAIYRQLLDGERREIELQKEIINKLEQQIKGDN